MFKDGSYFDKEFDTRLEPILVVADVHIFGDHLVLDELLFYPLEGERLPIGVKQAFEIFRMLRILAKEQGFSELTVGFHRTGAGRHGRTISFTRSLL